MSTPRSSKGNLSKSAGSDQFAKLLITFKKLLLNWKKTVVTGKPILDAILAIVKGKLGEESAASSSYDLELQRLIDALRSSVNYCRNCVNDLESTEKKLEAAAQLDADSKIAIRTLSHVRKIIKAYREQTEMMADVVEGICFSKSADEAIYYVCIWVHQPALSEDCKYAEKSTNLCNLPYFHVSLRNTKYFEVMAASKNFSYVYPTIHHQVELTTPLWKLKKNRSEEWEEIVRTLERSPDEFEFLVVSPEVNQSFPEKKGGYATPADFLNQCGSLNLTFGWLLEVAINNLEFQCNFITLLRDLHDTYEPLKVTVVDDKERHKVQELGDTFHFGVKASGVPTPSYKWMMLPLEDGDGNWVPIDVEDPTLIVENFQMCDAGTYRCYISHRLPVTTPDGVEIKGVFSPSFEVEAVKGSLLILEHPKDFNDGVIGGQASFTCKAEANGSLNYQWFHDDTLLLGQTKERLDLKQLWLESAGGYSCKCYNKEKAVYSEKALLKVTLPTDQQLENGEVTFDNKNIVIIQHPVYESETRAAIGDKVVLGCKAVCKFPLKYEWIKQGLRKDLISGMECSDRNTPPIPVALGSHLYDEIEEICPPVSAWYYQCVITCPKTNERKKSDVVTVNVSTFTTPEKSLPVFKIALVICQEVYTATKYFHPLRAPKNDGRLLIKALKELDFQVLAFSNLTIQEVRNAMDMFTSMISGHTYALFYYNGHAMGYGNDVYLVAKDTDLDAKRSLSETLLWHGEVETKLDSCSPLSFTVIYDSCRDNPPECIAEMVRAARHEPFYLSSNFCIGYGTRPSMRSFEKIDLKNGKSQGLYMKYLLKHLTTPGLSVRAIFDNLYSSFLQDEDCSVVARMKPEVRSSTKNFSLDAPLRQAACSPQYRLFFNIFRFESTAQLNPNEEFCFDLGLRWCSDKIEWVTGARLFTEYEKRVQVTMVPTTFNNEVDLTLSLSTNQDYRGEKIVPCPETCVQVIPVNCSLNVDVPDSSLTYEMCPRKPVNGEVFEDGDGPIFNISEHFLATDEVEVGRCQLCDLQTYSQDLKFRILLKHNGRKILCKGVMEFPLPIIRNYPKLKMSNILFNQAMS